MKCMVVIEDISNLLNQHGVIVILKDHKLRSGSSAKKSRQLENNLNHTLDQKGIVCD